MLAYGAVVVGIAVVVYDQYVGGEKSDGYAAEYHLGRTLPRLKPCRQPYRYYSEKDDDSHFAKTVARQRPGAGAVGYGGYGYCYAERYQPKAADGHESQSDEACQGEGADGGPEHGVGSDVALCDPSAGAFTARAVEPGGKVEVFVGEV